MYFLERNAGVTAVVAIIVAIIACFTPVTTGRTNGEQVAGNVVDTSYFDYFDAKLGFKVNGTTLINSSGLANFTGGQLYSNTNSTSTPATAQTLAVADLNGYDTVLLTPTIGSLALTFPASTTASTWLPSAGNTQKTCFENSTTTAGVYISFASGTGFDLQVASSSGSTLGSARIAPQKIGCFTFVRGKATASTFDIHAAYTAFQ